MCSVLAAKIVSSPDTWPHSHLMEILAPLARSPQLQGFVKCWENLPLSCMTTFEFFWICNGLLSFLLKREEILKDISLIIYLN